VFIAALVGFASSVVCLNKGFDSGQRSMHKRISVLEDQVQKADREVTMLESMARFLAEKGKVPGRTRFGVSTRVTGREELFFEARDPNGSEKAIYSVDYGGVPQPADIFAPQ